MGESKPSGISEIDALRATISVVEQQRENYRQDAKEARAQVSALQAEVERWKTSFDGHVYVTDADFDALCRRAEKAEAEAKRLNALLAPFVAYAKAHQRSMWGSGEIGGVIGPDGLRCAIRDSDLMALLEAPSDNPLTETKEGSDA